MLNVLIISVLMLLAILLILVEIFFFPGVTLAGISGFLFAIGGIWYAYTIDTLWGNICVIVSVIAFFVIFWRLLRSKSLNMLALHAEVDSTLPSSKDLGIKVGDKGIALSRLTPIGKARINEVIVEAKSWGEFIDENTPIVVLKVEGYNVTVKPVEINV